MNIFNRFKDFLRYLGHSPVYMTLLVLFLLSGIWGVFYNQTPVLGAFLLMAAMNIVYTVNEKGRFFDKLLSLGDKYHGLLKELDLPNPQRKTTIIETIVYTIIAIGSIWMFYVLAITLTYG